MQRSTTVVTTLLIPAASLLLAGCGSTTPSTPNPFLTADRVPPPLMRQVAPGTAQPYYGPATTLPPAAAAPIAPPAGYAPPVGAPPAAAPAWGAPPPVGAPAYGAPPPAGPLGSVGRSASQFASMGETVAVPSDNGSLRFAAPEAASLARATAPRPATTNATRLAATPTRPPVSANSWIAGSAPVRTQPTTGLASDRPRVRLPGGSRQPVSLAAIEPPRSQGVRESPLEPAPFRGSTAPGEPAPLRVATPPASTGWR